MKWLIIVSILFGCVKNINYDIGQEYIGAKYVSDPLGEGINGFPDTDPLIRTDAFDCTTFVETAIAGGNLKRLTEIRYKDGNISFLNRNHFIETDWLRNNSDILEIISEKYADTDKRIVTVDKQNWFLKVHNIKANIPKQTVALEYIPYKNISYINNAEPLIVFFISGKSEKCDKIGTDLAVTHMGFLIPGGTLRHASSRYGVVMDTDFYEYIKHQAENKNNLGIMLVKIK